MVEHRDELLSDPAQAALGALAEDNPEVDPFVTHLGLLELCRTDEVEARLKFLERREGLDGPPGEAGDPPIPALPRARLVAGLRPNDP